MDLSFYRNFCTVLLVILLIITNVSFNKIASLQRDYKECLVSYEALLHDYEKLSNNYKKLSNENRGILYDFTNEEIYMLAQCVEAEAGDNNFESQRYVTQVILNRLNSDRYPNTLKEVIYQKSGKIPQFSVAYNGSMNREVKLDTLFNVLDVLEDGTDMPDDVFYFYADYVTDNWVNTRETYRVVEGTVFAY